MNKNNLFGLAIVGALAVGLYLYFKNNGGSIGGGGGGYGGIIDIPPATTQTPGVEQKILTYTLGSTTRTVSKPGNKLVSVHPKNIPELRTRLSDARNLTTLGVSPKIIAKVLAGRYKVA